MSKPAEKEGITAAISFSYLGFKTYSTVSEIFLDTLCIHYVLGIEATVLCIKIGGSKSEIEQSEYTGSSSFMATADHPIWYTK